MFGLIHMLLFFVVGGILLAEDDGFSHIPPTYLDGNPISVPGFQVDVVRNSGRTYYCIYSPTGNHNQFADQASFLRDYQGNLFGVPDNFQTLVVVSGHGTYSPVPGNPDWVAPVGIAGFDDLDQVAQLSTRLAGQVNADGIVLPGCYTHDLSPSLAQSFANTNTTLSTVLVNRNQGPASHHNQDGHVETRTLDGDYFQNGSIPVDEARNRSRVIYYSAASGGSDPVYVGLQQGCGPSNVSTPRRRVDRSPLGGGGGGSRTRRRGR